jgi:hypothetical protein
MMLVASIMVASLAHDREGWAFSRIDRRHREECHARACFKV